MTSSADANTTVNTLVSVRAVSDTWTVRTLSNGCAGTPAPGTVCQDGSVFAGYSPDGNVKMYSTPVDAVASRFAWPETVAHDYSHWTTGKANTAGLAAFAAYEAANACAKLEAHGHDDWYLPAPYEMSVLRVHGAAIGGFDLAQNTRYWTSAEAGGNQATFHRRDGYTGTAAKGTTLPMRCVRRDMNSSEFSFTNRSDVAPTTTVTSNVIEMTGVGGEATVSIQGGPGGQIDGSGEYRICVDANCTGNPAFVSMPSGIADGAFLQLRLTSSSAFATATSLTIGVGPLVTTWTLTTAAQDVTPNGIAFPSQVVVGLSTPIDSAMVGVTGITGNVPISIAGAGQYRVCADATCTGSPAFGAAPATITNGKFVQLRVTSSGAYGTPVSTTLTVGSVSAGWTVTTFTSITDGQVVAACTPTLNNGTPPPRPNAPVTCSASVSSGGLAPYQYEFRVYEASASSWSTVRAYGPSGVLSWTPPHTGDFQLELRVRSAGSTAAYEAHVTTAGFTVQAAGATDVLGSGQALYPGQGVFSADGRYGLTYQGDGNLVLYGPGGVPRWSTSTSGTPGVALMQADGNLVVLSNGTVVWQTGTTGYPGAYLRVLSDGNLVLFSAGGGVLMSTGTGGGDEPSPEAAPAALALAPGGPDGGSPGAASGRPATPWLGVVVGMVFAVLGGFLFVRRASVRGHLFARWGRVSAIRHLSARWRQAEGRERVGVWEATPAQSVSSRGSGRDSRRKRVFQNQPVCGGSIPQLFRIARAALLD